MGNVGVQVPVEPGNRQLFSVSVTEVSRIQRDSFSCCETLRNTKRPIICSQVCNQSSHLLRQPPDSPACVYLSVSPAGAASHSRVFRVWRGGEGGHGGLGGGEVQPLSDGVHHLQRDHPSQLPEGEHAALRADTHTQSAFLTLCVCLWRQMGKAEGIINDEIPNCWECPKCHKEGKTSKVRVTE